MRSRPPWHPRCPPWQVLKDNGGAIKVAAGGAFCTALTRSGRVVIWGQPASGDGSADLPAAGLAAMAAAAAAHDAAPHPPRTHGRRRRRGGLPAVRAAPRLATPPPAAAQQAAEQQEVPNLRIQKQGGLLVAEVLDLPPMTNLVSGFSHIAFTDGASVWCIGRCGQRGLFFCLECAFQEAAQATARRSAGELRCCAARGACLLPAHRSSQPQPLPLGNPHPATPLPLRCAGTLPPAPRRRRLPCTGCSRGA